MRINDTDVIGNKAIREHFCAKFEIERNDLPLFETKCVPYFNICSRINVRCTKIVLKLQKNILLFPFVASCLRCSIDFADSFN